MTDRRAPVQGVRNGYLPGYLVRPGTVAWAVHEQAWAEYARAGHGDQSAERIAERGGFGYGEIRCALAGHYNRCGICDEDHPAPPTWEPR